MNIDFLEQYVQQIPEDSPLRAKFDGVLKEVNDMREQLAMVQEVEPTKVKQTKVDTGKTGKS